MFGKRTVTSLLLAGALAMPVTVAFKRSPRTSIMTATGIMNEMGIMIEIMTKSRYDEKHHDSHALDNREDSASALPRRTSKNYEDFNKLSAQRQRSYWNWRHQHPDGDRDGCWAQQLCDDESRLSPIR